MKERIIQSAYKLFWRYGIKSVTMDDIARELGISKRTIYQHYADKEAILELVIRQVLADEQCEIERIDEQGPNPVEQMIFTTEQMQQTLTHMNPTFLYDLKKYYPDAWGLFDSYKHEVILRHIRDNLDRGIALGLYHADIDTEILSLLRVEQVMMAFDHTIFTNKKHNVMYIQLELLTHFLRGILSEKGLQHYNSIKGKSAIEYNTHEK
ncbi:TetR/AcrR family transcriptional regulator [Dyadobacter sandarakinus]|uniref:TetR/AcrR family transcriptional regulator n=1 Tax=Dyadobacter sandarakinus TaxID=2747268 RepID=UPI001E5AA4BF|nr:TetR/AcrR family transcriptional regulator [Dyadobacter sandarakinus]